MISLFIFRVHKLLMIGKHGSDKMTQYFPPKNKTKWRLKSASVKLVWTPTCILSLGVGDHQRSSTRLLSYSVIINLPVKIFSVLLPPIPKHVYIKNFSSRTIVRIRIFLRSFFFNLKLYSIEVYFCEIMQNVFSYRSCT